MARSEDQNAAAPDPRPDRNPASAHDTADWFEQRDFDIRFGWGPNGLRRLAPHSDVVVVVDVLSFSTSVDIALGRGVVVLPYRWHDGSEAEFAKEHNAEVAQRTRAPEQGWSLSPASLNQAPAGLRLVLPSPNGSALTFGAAEAGAATVHVACLRNAAAVAQATADAGTIAVIAAGERWRGATGPLRPALEDQLGGGAVLSALAGLGRTSASPEAKAAQAAFEAAKADDLTRWIEQCGSGVELIDKGYPQDVALAAALNTSQVVPTLAGLELVSQ